MGSELRDQLATRRSNHLMTNEPERGKTDTCPDCGVAQANQHSIGQSAICDGIRNGYVDKFEGQKRIKELGK